jgi:hypothetical protein
MALNKCLTDFGNNIPENSLVQWHRGDARTKLRGFVTDVPVADVKDAFIVVPLQLTGYVPTSVLTPGIANIPPPVSCRQLNATSVATAASTVSAVGAADISMVASQFLLYKGL